MKLYASTPTQRFMRKCNELGVQWAIFSDEYGVWFSDEKHQFYDKNPNTVKNEEFRVLVESFDTKLRNYDEIWFYHNPGRFHKLYRRLLVNTKLKERVRLFTHLREIR